MDLRIIRKSMAIPDQGFVVNVESQKQDAYENDDFFSEAHVDYVVADGERYLAAPNAVLFFHAAFIQGIGSFSGTAPHPEMGAGVRRRATGACASTTSGCVEMSGPGSSSGM